MQKIENLKKLRLFLTAGTSSGVADLEWPESEFEFIFGLGSGGISPFEYDLAEKTIGDEVVVHLSRQTFHDYLMHLQFQLPVHRLFEDRDSFYLTIRVDAIEQADNREIVKTMAELAGHGNGCGCGCGC